MKHLSNSPCPVVTFSLLALNVLLIVLKYTWCLFLPQGTRQVCTLKEVLHAILVQDLSYLGRDTVLMGKVFMISRMIFIFRDSLGLLCLEDADHMILQSGRNHVPSDTVSCARSLDQSSALPLQETAILQNYSVINFYIELCCVGDRNIHSVWTR
jgi:hypothetical protein